jgi:hypothetical protein
MQTHKIKNIIDKNKENIAFLIGNGINRYANERKNLSWEDLLKRLWNEITNKPMPNIPEGISLTEFYDVLDIENTERINLQKKVSRLLDSWNPLTHHNRIIEKIQSINAPVLTTNFDEILAKTFGYKTYRITNVGFTDFYPWTTYHGLIQHKSPMDGFGVWYINGMNYYHRSIRLGLSHYMGSVERVKKMLPKRGHKKFLFHSDQKQREGSQTWLHIIFNKPLFVFGVALKENETFLRWLFIQRMKLYKKHFDQKPLGWYISKIGEDITADGKRFFLEKVGFEVIEVEDYKDIYENAWH